MAWIGKEKICEVRGEVCVDTSHYEPGTIELWKDGLLDLFTVIKTTGAATEFIWDEESSITATHDSLIFSEVKLLGSHFDASLGLGPLIVLGTTEVHLKGAHPNQLRLFINNLPPFFKDIYLREPTRVNRETRQEQKATLHEKPTRIAQQLTSREEQLQQQKEFGEGRQREPLREKEKKESKKQNIEKQLREMEQQLRGKDEQQQNLEKQLREMEKQLAHCQGQLRKNEKQETKLQKQLKEKEQQLTSLRCDNEKENAYLQQKLSLQLKELDDLQKELRDREQDNVDLQKDLSAAKETVSKYESQLRSRDWVLNRDEIQLTDYCLGAGGWGRVFKGRFCGCAVAIKQLHQPTLSPQERDLFEREMDIASRCRHPCLLQFIGATQDEKSPLFVTELMETSLRALLGKRHLSGTEITVISLDVARALNYLHQRKPEPIVHRDVSSANVLLWKQNDQWKGKLSDYGTVRFLQEIMTKAPGNISYSAPEVGSPYNQTVKIDVYSFGVLFCEMCTAKLPVIENRVEQVKLVTNKEFQGLIMWCIEEDPEDRPSMEEIIKILEKFNGIS